MSLSQQQPQQHDAFEDVMSEMKRSLSETVERSIPRVAPSPQPATPAPAGRAASPEAGAGVGLWGPSSPRITSPLQLLMEVADNAVRLKKQVELLNEAVTGEPPVVRTRAAIKLETPLLPAVAQLATEIGNTHAEIAHLIMHLRERL
jgi:hypothetical protein